MSQLTIEGLDVRVAVRTTWEDQPWGDVSRRFSGRMSSDVTARHRVYRFVTPELEEADKLALELMLRSPGPLLCSGDLIGTEAAFHARVNRVTPLETGTDFVIDFTLEESGSVLDVSPLLFSFDGDAPGAYTHTRSGVAYYLDSDGVLQQAADGVPRFTHLDLDGDGVFETLAYLGEPARTNLVTSDDIENDWTLVSGATVTPGQDDPAGGTGAFTVEDDGASVQYVRRAVTFTGDAPKCVVFTVRENTMASSGDQILEVFDATTTQPRGSIAINGWTDGEPDAVDGPGGGGFLGKVPVGNGYWDLHLRTISLTAANTNQVRVYPAAEFGATGAIDVYRVNAFDDLVGRWLPLDAGATQNADSIWFPIGFAPQALSVYLRFVEGGTVFSSGQRTLLHIGGTGFNGPSMTVYANGSNTYAATYRNGIDGNVVVALPFGPPLAGQEVELLVTFDVTRLSDMLQIEQSIEGGASTSASDGLSVYSGYGGTQFDLQRLWLSAAGTVAGTQGINPIISAKVVRGVWTMDQMRDFARARSWVRAA